MKNKLWTKFAVAILLLTGFASHALAACSAYQGKVVFNEVYDPSSGSTYLEIKVLDPAVLSASNNFAGWKIDLYKNNVSTQASVDLSSVFSDTGDNVCGRNSAWIRIPDSELGSFINGSNGSNNLNFVMYETAGSKIVDILRLGAASSFYGAGRNYASCSSIESALPSSQYDAAWGSNGNKDWYRDPDGTGPWGGQGTSNGSNSICGSNNGGGTFALSKVASVSTVATGTNFSFALTAQNGSTGSALSGVAITDNLNTAGLTFVSCTTANGTCTNSGGVVAWNIGSVAANSTKEATLTVSAASSGTKTNTITANITGSPTATDSVTVTWGSALDHLQISDSNNGAGVTCAPSTLTVLACANASCSALYTGGVTGTLTATGGSGTANWGGGTASFTIPSGASSVTKTFQLTSSASVSTTLGATSTATNAATCTFTNCLYNAANAGFIFAIPNHVAATSQSVAVSAVRKSDSATVCVPAFANVTRQTSMSCSYQNPSNGTLPMVANGVAVNASNNASAACGSNTVSLAFNASGVATVAVSYADVGQVTQTIAYTGSSATGDTGLSMSGSGSFIAAPKDFAFSNVTTGLIKAGNNFSATVTARNAVAATTPNFGKETTPEGVTVSFTKYQPTGTAAVTGSLSGSVGSFGAGSASGSSFTWSEVGTIDLTASLTSASYLGSGLSASGNTGSTGAVGRFIPDHFDTVVTQACVGGSFTYSGQPFTAQVTARNLAGGITRNYDGSVNTTPNFSKVTTLSNAGSTANFSNNSLSGTDFAAGVGTKSTLTYTFPAVTTAPLSMNIRAQDTDGVVSSAVEGTVAIRSGRLKMQNAYGSELLDLPVTMRAEYLASAPAGWQLNSADSCTVSTLSFAAVGATNITGKTCVLEPTNNSGKGCAAALPAATPNRRYLEGGVTGTDSNGVAGFAGNFNLWLKAPGSGFSGSIDLTATAPTWLQYNWTGTLGSPTARATFGVYKSPLIYRRENY